MTFKRTRKETDGFDGMCIKANFANFYMGHLEKITFSKITKPKMYCRCVNDICHRITKKKKKTRD